jgi:DNA-binding NtrC family response regulator
MIRLLVYSQDAVLQKQLAVTLGDEFCLFVEPRMDRIATLVARLQCDVLILDLDSVHPLPLLFFDEIRAFDVPVVVMIDDDSSANIMDLARRGFYNFIRRPPAMPELKIVIRRVHEYAWLTRQLRNLPRRLPRLGLIPN